MVGGARGGGRVVQLVPMVQGAGMKGSSVTVLGHCRRQRGLEGVVKVSSAVMKFVGGVYRTRRMGPSVMPSHSRFNIFDARMFLTINYLATSVYLPKVDVKVRLVRVDLAFSCTKGYPGQVKRHGLPFQVEAALKYLVVPLAFAHDCSYSYITQYT